MESLKKDFPEISSVFTRPNYVEFIIRQTKEAKLDWEQKIKSRLILKGFNMGVTKILLEKITSSTGLFFTFFEERALKSTDRNAMTR